MKKILLVGDGNHQFIRYLAKWLKKTNSEQLVIDILSTAPVKEESFFNHIYYVKLTPMIISKIPKIRTIWSRQQFLSQLQSIHNNYDVINFHFICIMFANIIKINFSAKIILSFWGSDFYRATAEKKIKIKKIIDKSSMVTVTNPQMKEDIKAHYQDFTKNIETVRFGLEPLENLKNINLSKIESKKTLDIEKHKIVVTVGYNRSPHQHHVEILRAIESILSKMEKEQIVILLPLTYGSDLKYVEKIKDFLSQLTIEYKIFFKFMTNEEVAYLRQATDIFIQLQTTDQFSGSMQEHMYAKNVVITGSWLPYRILEDNDVYFHKINKVDEIGNKLKQCIVKFNEEIKKVQKNDEIIYKLSGWPNVIDDWNKVYNLK